MWQFVVAPHRGVVSSGLWSVRLDGFVVGIHSSYADAMHDAVHRAAVHWLDAGEDSQILVVDGSGWVESSERYDMAADAG